MVNAPYLDAHGARDVAVDSMSSTGRPDSMSTARCRWPNALDRCRWPDAPDKLQRVATADGEPPNCTPRDTVEGVRVGCFPDLYGALASNPPDHVITL